MKDIKSAKALHNTKGLDSHSTHVNVMTKVKMERTKVEPLLYNTACVLKLYGTRDLRPINYGSGVAMGIDCCRPEWIWGITFAKNLRLQFDDVIISKN